MERAGEDFLRAKSQCCALLAVLSKASDFNLILPRSGAVESHSVRLLALLDSVQPYLAEDELVHLRAQLQQASGQGHHNAALQLNPSSAIMTPLSDYATVAY